MIEETREIGSTNFFEWVADKIPPIRKSLATLSGQPLDDRRTSLTQRASKAWSTPVNELTCEQVRLLVSQKMGLKWLAAPVIAFVHAYPLANVTFYEGALTLAALKAMRELLDTDSNARTLAALDLSPVYDHWLEVDPAFAQEIKGIVSEARSLAQHH